jgi:predicted O-methyltransferase YrrM
MRVSRIVAVVAALLTVVVAHALAQPAKPLDVPYVPTPEPVVMEMLKMANVGKNDVLYDLGSGDGRIVITAAQKYGARGVGIDLDPNRIREAEENARAAGVTDRVKFMIGDIFDTDIRAATVLTMYLLPDVNIKLRPKLLSELRPGTRIVSHNYDLGDWTPKSHKSLTINGTKHDVYFWVVPAKSSLMPRHAPAAALPWGGRGLRWPAVPAS